VRQLGKPSGRKVTTQVFESVEEVRHISLAKKANFIIIAPATADLIARIAGGRADDLLTNVVLASDSPILIVPAMHPQMWNDAATQANVESLRARGYVVMDPDVGALTSGDVGQGRFPETVRILDEFSAIAQSKMDLLGKKVLVTSGGTREAIDPVRFIGNQSSGKQGYAVARSAQQRGAEVTLIAANSNLQDLVGVRTIHVESASEMLQALQQELSRPISWLWLRRLQMRVLCRLLIPKLRRINLRRSLLLKIPICCEPLLKQKLPK
jgi:phosphopantothenoylcysteine decarboxylase/phosphopantothenate--cysteine ligase